MDFSKFIKFFNKSFEDAASSLSQLLNKNMNINTSKIEYISADVFLKQIEEKLDEGYFASIIKVSDKFSIYVVLIIPEKEGLRFFDYLYGNPQGTSSEITNDILSTIGEINNIIGSTVINNIANHIGTDLQPEVPVTKFDLLGAILQGIVLESEFAEEDVLYADTIITEEEKEAFKTRLLIISDKDEISKVMKGL